MRAVTWDDVRREYESQVVGELILEEARRAVVSATARYDPRVYAEVDDWTQVVDDVVQQLVVGLLLEDGQLDYMMLVAGGLDEFRSLMLLQVRRLLARTRTRTVIDNLLDRAQSILVEPPFAPYPLGSRRTLYALPDAEPRGPRADEVWRAARRAALVPRVGIGQSDRAPIVYSNADLKSLLLCVADELGCRFGLSDIDAILRLTLTDLLPNVLLSDEASISAPSTALSVENEVMVSEAVTAVLESLDESQRLLLREKLSGISDAELASMRGVSRPTLASRKTAVFRVLERHLEGLERSLQVEALDRIGFLLASGEVRP